MTSTRSKRIVVTGLLAIAAGVAFLAVRSRTPPAASTELRPAPAAAVAPAPSATPRRPLDDAFKAAMEHDTRAVAGRAEDAPVAAP